MKLWVGRHSCAGPAAPDDDPALERERGLTPDGKKLALAMARELRKRISGKLEPSPKVIFASPFARAMETADIYGAILRVPVDVVDDLSPNRPLEDRVRELMSHSTVKRIMIVAHQDNTTPMFNDVGGTMGDETRDDDDDLRIELGHVDGSTPGSGDDNPDAAGDWVPLVMAEIRRLRIDRKSMKWEVRSRLRPSDIGLEDIVR